MSRKTLLIVGVVVLAVLGAMAWYAMSGSSSDTPATASGKNYEIYPTDRTLGNPKSKVVLIEYAAPSCPVCAAFNAQSFGRLKTQYIDTGKIFYVFRVFPLRPDDGAAEKIARVTWASKIDLRTGRPVEIPGARFPNGQSFDM